LVGRITAYKLRFLQCMLCMMTDPGGRDKGCGGRDDDDDGNDEEQEEEAGGGREVVCR
jgi:hypothetical protein